MSKEYLDRKEVEKITDNYVVTARRTTGLPTGLHKDLMVDQICKLKPKNQIVIAGGEVSDYLSDIFIGGIYIEEKLFNYLGESGTLIFIKEE